MKTFASILLIGFLMFFSTGTLRASDDHDGHERQNRSKFYGTVEKMPDNLHGTWIVNGRSVTVTPQTHIEQEYGRAAVGAFVEIKGGYDGRDFSANEIEVKQGARSAAQDASSRKSKGEKLYGTIARLPDGGLVGTWMIDNREIHVDERTRIDEKHGKVAVGTPVEAKGSYRGESFRAQEIEVKEQR